MEFSYEEQDFSDAEATVRKRRRYQARPKKTADLLGQLMARKGYNQIESQDELGQQWMELVGETYGSKTRVGVLRSGVLEVLVDSSAARQQLEFEKRKLVKQLQAKLPQNKIKDIRFKVTKLG